MRSSYKDLTGSFFGSLEVLGRAEDRITPCGSKKVQWRCKCHKCGKEVVLTTYRLKGGKTLSCGCDDPMIGKRFGRLVVLYKADHISKSGEHKTLYHCKCDCGNEVDVKGSSLKKGTTSSCGCLRREHCIRLKTKYAGLNSKSKLYDIYIGIKERCYNSNTHNYKYYGAKGIKMCPEWENSFEAFRDWSLKNGYVESLLSIDRIDVMGDYCPQNCRWATRVQQQNNTTKNRYLTLDGETHTVAEWGRIKGIKPKTIQARLKLSWSVEDALNKPVRVLNHKKYKDKKVEESMKDTVLE